MRSDRPYIISLSKTPKKIKLHKHPPEVFCKKMCSYKFRKFAGKHKCKRLLKKSLWHRCFPVKFSKFLITTFSHNTCGRLLLKLHTTLHRCSQKKKRNQSTSKRRSSRSKGKVKNTILEQVLSGGKGCNQRNRPDLF